MDINLFDTLILKKPHACGGKEFTVIRLGADVKLKCNKCGHVILFSREKFNKFLR